MKVLFSILLAVATLTGVIDGIATINRHKKAAAEAFQAQEYTKAIRHYKTLLDSLDVQDENIRMNLAHAYLMSGDTTAAQQHYTQLINSHDKPTKSVAYQQLGTVHGEQAKYKEALSFFKESLKADPANEEARYNYELIKKLLKQQEDNQPQQGEDQQQQQNQDQQQEDNQQQKGEDQQQQQQGEEGEEGEPQKEEQQEGEQGDQGEQQPQQPDEQQQQQEGQQPQEGEQKEDEQANPSVSDKLREMNISEEKARMILDAMRNSEMQYIQQNRRKVTQPQDNSKPDW